MLRLQTARLHAKHTYHLPKKIVCLFVFCDMKHPRALFPGSKTVLIIKYFEIINSKIYVSH